MAGEFKKPSWFVDLSLDSAGGSFQMGWFQHRNVPKPTGEFDPGGYEERKVAKPTGNFNPGSIETDAPEDLDPWGNYYFSLEIDDVEVAHFLEASGLKTESDVYPIEEGGKNDTVHKRPGHSTWQDITLKRAVHKGTLFAEWRDKYMTGEGWEGGRSSAAIVMRNNAGDELRRFTILQAWPISWEGPSLNAGGSELSTEVLVIAHEGILIDQEPPEEPENPEPEPEPDEELEPVQFGLDRHDLDEQGQETCDENADKLNETPTDEKTYYVEGHTCTLPHKPGTTEPKSWSHGYNLKLSQKRAQTVADEMSAQAGQGKTYVPKGYSFDHPVASNETEAGRSRNRRCNIWPDARSGKRSGELK